MPSDGFVPGNRLLAAMPRETVERLAPEFETVPIRVPEVLHKVGRPVEHVYLPHSGMGSIVTPLRRGIRIEAATIGNEGLLGVAYLLGASAAGYYGLAAETTRQLMVILASSVASAVKCSA